MKRNEKGQFTTKNKKDKMMRVTKDEKNMLSKLRQKEIGYKFHLLNKRKDRISELPRGEKTTIWEEYEWIKSESNELEIPSNLLRRVYYSHTMNSFYLQENFLDSDKDIKYYQLVI